MGLFDDSLKNAVPGGNLATPIAIAAGALILGKLFGGGSSQAPAAPASVPTPLPAPTEASSGSIMGGLSDLIGKLTAGGAGSQVNSWVGHGPNEPIEPGQLGNAIGGDVLDQLAAKTGMTKEQLLSQLATVLPQLINGLTPKGRMPTLAEFDER